MVVLSSFRISEIVSLRLHALVLHLELDVVHSAGYGTLLVLNAGALLVADCCLFEKVSDARNRLVKYFGCPEDRRAEQLSESSHLVTSRRYLAMTVSPFLLAPLVISVLVLVVVLGVY